MSVIKRRREYQDFIGDMCWVRLGGLGKWEASANGILSDGFPTKSEALQWALEQMDGLAQNLLESNGQLEQRLLAIKNLANLAWLEQENAEVILRAIEDRSNTKERS